jgi:hypothetical protein
MHDWGHSYINGFTNVSIRAIMGGTVGTICFPYLTITNGSGSDRTIEFSSVTNLWRWYYAQSGVAPSVLTNGTQLEISFRVNGTNVLASYGYAPWP